VVNKVGAMIGTETLTMIACPENLEPLLCFVVEAASKAGFDREALAEIRLACEEIIANIIAYAYGDRCAEKTLSLTCRTLGPRGRLEVEIRDTGKEFDPVSQPLPDVTAPVHERRIGGLGIFLARKVLDSISYRRENGANILLLVKR